jgi:ankyrin repeat protein
MSIKLPFLLALSLLLSSASTVAADNKTAIKEDRTLIRALFHVENDGFTPPAKNQALQALLAKHPALTFFEACGVGDTAEVARQLKRDPRLATAWSELGFSAVHLAAFSGVPELLKLLLDHGGQVNINARARTRFKNTPLQYALLSGQLATARLLLERGADPMVRQALGFSPLHEAALFGRRDLVDLLIDAGAELNSRTDDGRTPLTEALRRKHTELAEYLRSKGARGAEITSDLTQAPAEPGK